MFQRVFQLRSGFWVMCDGYQFIIRLEKNIFRMPTTQEKRRILDWLLRKAQGGD